MRSYLTKTGTSFAVFAFLLSISSPAFAIAVRRGPPPPPPPPTIFWVTPDESILGDLKAIHDAAQPKPPAADASGADSGLPEGAVPVDDGSQQQQQGPTVQMFPTDIPTGAKGAGCNFNSSCWSELGAESIMLTYVRADEILQAIPAALASDIQKKTDQAKKEKWESWKLPEVVEELKKDAKSSQHDVMKSMRRLMGDDKFVEPGYISRVATLVRNLALGNARGLTFTVVNFHTTKVLMSFKDWYEYDIDIRVSNQNLKSDDEFTGMTVARMRVSCANNGFSTECKYASLDFATYAPQFRHKTIPHP